MGYPQGYKGYKLYDLLHKKFLISRDVIFHESIFPFKQNVQLGLHTQSPNAVVLPSIPDLPSNIDYTNTSTAPTPETSHSPVHNNTDDLPHSVLTPEPTHSPVDNATDDSSTDTAIANPISQLPTATESSNVPTDTAMPIPIPQLPTATEPANVPPKDTPSLLGVSFCHQTSKLGLTSQKNSPLWRSLPLLEPYWLLLLRNNGPCFNLTLTTPSSMDI